MDPLASRTQLRSGDIVAEKYRIEEILGGGETGVVFAATHLTLGQRVALKVLRREGSARKARAGAAEQSEVATSRFFREARIAAALESEHIVRVDDLGVLADGTPFMVMELLEGRVLRQHLAEHGPLELAEAVDLVRQACDALELAHAANVVHRDLTPSHLFLAQREGRPIVKVLDFGVARLAPGTSASAQTLTASKTLLGSPIYAAPELLRSAREATPRSDVWSLGAVLYELITGKPAFSGKTVAETCAAVIRGAAPGVEESRRGVPPRLRAIVNRCLRTRPAARFANAGELGRELAKFHRAITIGTMDTLPARYAPGGLVPARVASEGVLPCEPAREPRSLSGATERAPRSDAPVALPMTSHDVHSARRRSLLWSIAVVEGVALVFGGILFLRPAAPTSSGSQRLAEAAAHASSAPAREVPDPAPSSDPPTEEREPAAQTTVPLRKPKIAAVTDGGTALKTTPASAPSASASAWPWGDRY
jgi:serine/threonine protein kinase